MLARLTSLYQLKENRSLEKKSRMTRGQACPLFRFSIRRYYIDIFVFFLSICTRSSRLRFENHFSKILIETANFCNARKIIIYLFFFNWSRRHERSNSQRGSCSTILLNSIHCFLFVSIIPIQASPFCQSIIFTSE